MTREKLNRVGRFAKLVCRPLIPTIWWDKHKESVYGCAVAMAIILCWGSAGHKWIAGKPTPWWMTIPAWIGVVAIGLMIFFTVMLLLVAGALVIYQLYKWLWDTWEQTADQPDVDYHVTDKK